LLRLVEVQRLVRRRRDVKVGTRQRKVTVGRSLGGVQSKGHKVNGPLERALQLPLHDSEVKVNI
jgi:hypothetical protein